MMSSFLEDFERLIRPLKSISAIAELQRISQGHKITSALEILRKQHQLIRQNQLLSVRSAITDIQERLSEQQRMFQSLLSSAICAKDSYQLDKQFILCNQFHFYILQESARDMDYTVWSALSNGPPNSVKSLVQAVLESTAPIAKCSAVGFLESVRSQINTLRKAFRADRDIRRGLQLILRAFERSLAKNGVTLRTWAKATLLPKTRIRATCGLLTTFQTCAP